MRAILTINAGSSSLKLGWFDADTLSCIARDTLKPDASISDWIGKRSGTLVAVGHRIVHGGSVFANPIQVHAPVLVQLKTLIPLAPLHLPHNISLVEKLLHTYPDCPQIACFDTAFHHTIEPLETRFAIPSALHDAGIRRYGFHGLSYAYIASVLPEHLGTTAAGKVVVAHLGNGSSMCAMRDGKSITTTMGFSTLDGLMMGSRCGTFDAGAVLHLQEQMELSAHEIHTLLYEQSGLLGVSGISKDMRELERSNDPNAALAINLYCRMAAKHLGSLMMVLGGLDALVFTGGIGEHSARTRKTILGYLEWFGVKLDTAQNDAHALRISMESSSIPVYVIPTNEELVIARACKVIL